MEHDPTAVDGIYRELAELARDHPAEPDVRRQWAMGAVNLISHFGGDPERRGRADEVYRELADLARDHPGKPEIQLWFAKASGALALRHPDAEAGCDLFRDLIPVAVAAEARGLETQGDGHRTAIAAVQGARVLGCDWALPAAERVVEVDDLTAAVVAGYDRLIGQLEAKAGGEAGTSA